MGIPITSTSPDLVAVLNAQNEILERIFAAQEAQAAALECICEQLTRIADKVDPKIVGIGVEPGPVTTH